MALSKGKEVAKKEATEVTVGADDFGTAGGIEDITIPRINVMQKMSKLLEDREDLKVGDFVESLADEKVGSIKDPLEFIPFYMEKLWFRSVKVGNSYEFLNVEDFSQANSRRRYYETVDGEDYKNELHYKFYCVLPSDQSIPYAITFKGMSQRIGKALYTQMYVKNKVARLSPAGKVMTLAGSKEENEKGSFIVLSSKVARDTTNEELRTALMWFKTVDQGGAATKTDAPESVTRREASYSDNNAQF